MDFLNFEQLATGLISGLVVTFIAILGRSVWAKVVVPWFEERVYKDAHIEGKWFSLYPESPRIRQEVINLERHGHQISGTMICINGGDKGEKYNLSGSFRNLILPLTYESTEKGKTDRGSLTLMCLANGEVLKGQIANYDTNHNTVQSAGVIWYRSQASLNQHISKLQSRANTITKLADDKRKVLKLEEDIQTPVKSTEEKASIAPPLKENDDS
jgi:hypothetical protein